MPSFWRRMQTVAIWRSRSTPACRQRLDAFNLFVQRGNPGSPGFALGFLGLQKPFLRFGVIAQVPVGDADGVEGMGCHLVADEFVTAGFGEGEGFLELGNGCFGFTLTL